jgi:Fe-S cluster biogenesis protein NfuA
MSQRFVAKYLDEMCRPFFRQKGGGMSMNKIKPQKIFIG